MILFPESLFPQIPAQPGRDAKMIHSIASLIRAKSKLLLLESPDTVEIYKVNREHFKLYITIVTVLMKTESSNSIYCRLNFVFHPFFFTSGTQNTQNKLCLEFINIYNFSCEVLMQFNIMTRDTPHISGQSVL